MNYESERCVTCGHFYRFEKTAETLGDPISGLCRESVCPITLNTPNGPFVRGVFPIVLGAMLACSRHVKVEASEESTCPATS